MATVRPFPTRFTEAEGAIIDYSKLRASAATEYSSEIPHHISQLIDQIMATPKLKRANRVLDMTAHVGGFALPWATKFPRDKVIAVEQDTKNFNNLQHNIKALKLKNVEAVHASSTDYMRDLKPHSFDFAYLDPPWGGPDYKYKKGMQLYLGQMSVPEIVQWLFDYSICEWVFLKAPGNYDFQGLPFRYTARTVSSPNLKKRVPDYLLVCINREGLLAGGAKKKSTKKKSKKKSTKKK